MQPDPAELREAREQLNEVIHSYYEINNSSSKDKKLASALLEQIRAKYLLLEHKIAAFLAFSEDFQTVNTIPDLLNLAGRGDITRLVARITAASRPEMWESHGRQRPGYAFELEDGSGATVATPLIFSDDVVHAALDAFHQGVPIEAIGSLAVIPAKTKPTPVFAVHRLQRLTSSLAAVGATPTETSAAKQLLHRCQGETSRDVLRNLVTELRQLHGVVTDGLPPLFEQAEMATVLQALSTGQLPRANPRLHTLVVGLPGSGKKILANYVKVLEPIALPAQASTLTRAGLAAGAQRQKDGLVAQPGLLPRAHLGAVVVEDVHGLRPGQRDQVFAVLAQVMEDGQVDLSNVARRHFMAETALHFDLNRRSQLKADSSLANCGPRALVADLGLRLDLLSRIDLIYELPASAEDARSGALAMLEPVIVPDEEERARTLRVLMAYLRDRYPEVNLEQVKDYSKVRLERLLTPLAACGSPDLDPAAFSRRMANSIQKLMAAAARLKQRRVAHPVDVDLAVELLKPKLTFIQALATATPSDLRDRVTRRAAIARAFSGREFSPVDVMDALNISRRTVMRDLEEIAEKVERGRYRIAETRCASGTSDAAVVDQVSAEAAPRDRKDDGPRDE